MALNPHEEQFARAFIVPAKQERYLSMLESAKGRARLLAKFPHCRDLNMSHTTLVLLSLALDFMPVGQRLIHRYFVHILNIPAHGHSHRNAGYPHAKGLQ
jgi:hypothetical protein